MISKAAFDRALVLATFAGLLLYWGFADFFGKEIVSEIAVYAILAMSLNLVAGYTGMVSLAHGALFGCGAYMYALFAATWGAPGLVAMVVAAAITCVVALAVGAVVSRVYGIFFIMATLAIGQMGHEYFFQSKVFGGDDGFAGIPRPDLSTLGIDTGDPSVFALILIIAAIACYAIVARLLVSPFGWTLVGIHENEQRMRALGLPTRWYKTSAMGVSGAVAGVAGALSAMHTQFITPQLLDWTTSGEVLIMVILGGLGTSIGPVIGAAVVILLRHELSAHTDYWSFWLGLFLIVVVLSRSNGVVGVLTVAWSRLGRGRGAKAAENDRAAC